MRDNTKDKLKARVVVFQDRQDTYEFLILLPNCARDGPKTWFDTVDLTASNGMEYWYAFGTDVEKVPSSIAGYKRIAKKDYPESIVHFIGYYYKTLY